MSETDFVFAWLLAAKAGSGIAVAWQASTVEAQLREAKEIYKQVTKESNNEADSRATN